MTHKPETFAHATVDGIPDTLVVRVDRPASGATWLTPSRLPDRGLWWYDSDVTDVRPLLVFNWHDPLSVAKRLRDGHALTAQDIASQIEEQVKPPRIPEPGLWGVIEDQFHEVWVCTEPHRWTRIADGVEWPWIDLLDPVLVRPGIGDEW